MIRVRELSKTTIEVAGELNIADRGGLTYVDIIGNDLDDARSMVEGIRKSAWRMRHVEALQQILDRMKDGDERTSLVDEDGRRIEA